MRTFRFLRAAKLQVASRSRPANKLRNKPSPRPSFRVRRTTDGLFECDLSYNPWHVSAQSKSIRGLIRSFFGRARGDITVQIAPNDMADAKSITTTSSGGTKRKRPPAPGFYAVKAGHKPGIYYSWQDVIDQTKGYSHAEHMKFNSLSEAEAWLNNESQAVGTRHRSGSQKFYAVQSGHTPGIYTDWPSAQRQITGFKGPKHKRFDTRTEAEAYVAAGRSSTSGTPISNDAYTEASVINVKQGCKVGNNASKKQKKNDGSALIDLTNSYYENYEPGTAPLLPDAEDEFDATINFNPITGNLEYKTVAQMEATKLHPTGNMNGPLIIYTDGSSRGNGREGAIAGVGVYFGVNDPRNVAEGLPGPIQTNNRAELTAIQRAIDIAPIDRQVIIYTDSNYSIKCLTEWFLNWRRNNWKNSAGKPVE